MRTHTPLLIVTLMAAGFATAAPGCSPVGIAGRQPTLAIQAPAFAVNQDGRVEIFAVSAEGRLMHNWEHSPGSATKGPEGFHGWDGIGGDNEIVGPVTAVRREDGRLQVYARGVNNTLKEVHQTNLGIWSSWRSLGGEFYGVPSATVFGDNRVAVYVRGLDGRAWVWIAKSPNSDDYSMSPLAGHTFDGDPVAIASPHGGAIEVYGRAHNSGFHRFVHTPGKLVVSWQPYLSSEVAHGRPAVAHTRSGLASVFRTDDQQKFLVTEQTSAQPARWSTAGKGWGTVGDAAATFDPSLGAISVYMRFTDDVIRRFDGEGWSAELGNRQRLAGDPAATVAHGMHYVVAVGRDGVPFLNLRDTEGDFSGWMLV